MDNEVVTSEAATVPAPATNQSVERAAALLRALAQSPGGIRVSEAARQAGLGQSTASRLLGTLESLGFVQVDPITNLYQLGPTTITLGGAALNALPIHRAARQTAQDLAGSTQLGANIAVRRGSNLFYICNFEGALAPKAFSLMGQVNPLHATALGKCLLLDLNNAARRELQPTLRDFTANTITDHKLLGEMLDGVRNRGYATEVEELALGRACIAAPIFGPSGEVAAALSLSGPLSVIDLEAREHSLSQIVVEKADSISVDLGYTGPGSSLTMTNTVHEL